ncbi:MAG: adenosylcobalamin-dependent ribonucleoside-diphosphate reductase [Phycisphaerales bacterium]|nr:adenosylcobalamin-dependent ribonucleoside-diphosphate reductase [Phycisphaerales bacterium]
MKIARRFTTQGKDVFHTVEWTKRTSRILKADGSTVFEMVDAEVPRDWSQLATDIVLSKYFRKAGVPQVDASGAAMFDENGHAVLGPEQSASQVVHRLAGCWKHWGERHGYFDSPLDAQAFYDEISWMLLTQAAAPNSPQWFNTGLNYAYGINGPAQGHWIADHCTGAASLASDSYSHPQPHACFIQSVNDDLVNDGGIMDLWVREARLFKYGSGTGTNFSSLRGEQESLSGGGKSSGLMSFLRVGDRAAGAIKSGGTTRRAAKMCCLDIDHPDIEQFINWKVREELKVSAMVEGLRVLPQSQRDVAARLGLKLDYDFNGEAYGTVSGQNSNNSVRLSDAFFDAVDADATWNLRQRTSDKPAGSIPARTLWSQINYAAWRCADPGVQFDSTINDWHTCPAGGRINASNPCSEYMFLDNTACNLASINLLKFYDADSRTFDVEGFEHAVNLWTVVLEISVLMAAFPSREIAELSWKYRTLGLGYANLGAMLMQAGVPYDSDMGRAVCGAITSVLTGRSYAASALMAKEHGAFAGFSTNRESMMRVLRNHRRAAQGLPRQSNEWESLRTRPVPLDHSQFGDRSDSTLGGSRIGLTNSQSLLSAALQAWDDALTLGERHGFRNAQVTVIAPTGTIGLLMDCDTTGVEPDFSITKFKKLAGGGHFKIANQSLRPALKTLGYSQAQIDAIIVHVMGTLSLDTALPTEDGTSTSGLSLREALLSKGYTNEELLALENSLPTVIKLDHAFSAWSVPERLLRAGNIDVTKARRDESFNGLRTLGFTRQQCEGLNRRICGSQTLEGAPHVRESHLPVFDCANRCGALGVRLIAPEGHIKMMAAAQPFVSGAISKTINLPNEATETDIADCYRLSWELGLKANALYRDGCKLSQPLSSKADSTESKEDSASESRTRTAAAAENVMAASAAPVLAAAPTAVLVTERIVERIVERVIERPNRRRLPDTRRSITHKFNVGGHEGYLIVGIYDDGRPGELFITMAKEGSTIGGLMDSLGTAISVALQYGVPVESLVNKFAHQRFEPMGMTTNDEIPFAKSLVDYIFRWFGMQFIPGYREANSPRRQGGADAHNTPVKEDTACIDQSGHLSNRTFVPTSPQAIHDRILSTHLAEERTVSNPSVHLDRSITAAPRTPLQDGVKVIVSTSSTTTDTYLDGPLSHSHTEQFTKSVLDQTTAQLMGDAPACDGCGSITVRNGTCYRCLNCGQSMGCS